MHEINLVYFGRQKKQGTKLIPTKYYIQFTLVAFAEW